MIHLRLMDIGLFIKKIKELVPMDDVITVLEKLPNNPTLNKISENAGTIGGTIKIVLHITKKFMKQRYLTKTVYPLF